MKGENRGDGVSIGIREQANGGTEGDEEEGKRGEGGRREGTQKWKRCDVKRNGGRERGVGYGKGRTDV